jgi:uncharacterized membrane protein
MPEFLDPMMKPLRTFLLLSSFFGLLFLVITPPFQPQDENCHFYRAYQVSEGRISAVSLGDRLGGYFPESLHIFYDNYHPFILTSHNKISRKELWETRRLPLDPEEEIFIDFTNTSLYPALLYLPQATGILIGRLMGAGPFWLLYLGRLCNLIFFIALTAWAIRILPFKKWLFVMLAALPMSHILHSSLSADAVVNALSYLIIAYILHLAYGTANEKLGRKETLLTGVGAALLGLAKLVYVPLLFLLLLIPERKFTSRHARYVILVLLLSAGFGAALIQKEMIDAKYIPYVEYNEQYRDYTALKWGVDINRQVDYIKENPLRTVRVFTQSYVREFPNMTRGYIAQVGWAHSFLPRWFVIITYVLILLLVVVRDPDGTPVAFPRWHRLLFGLIGLALTFLIMLSQYLSWDLVGEDRAYPLIGRYFIPVFPLFFLMISDVAGLRKKKTNRHFTGPGILVFGALSGILGLWWVLSGSYTTHTYTDPNWVKTFAFNNDHPGSGGMEYILSGQDTLSAFRAPGHEHLTDTKVLDGPASLMIHRKNPYGFSVRIFEGKKGDKVIASCRTYGRGGYINFQEHPNGVNTWMFKAYPLRDSLGWKYQEAAFILPGDIQDELRVFMWWPFTDSIYLDHFRLEYYPSYIRK